MEQFFIGINWIAVCLGAILSYVLGALWYSPIMFGEKWAAGTRANPEAGDRQPWLALVLQLVGTLLLAWLIALAAANNTWGSAFLIVLTLLTLMVAGNMFSGHSHYANLVQGGFVAVSALIISLCIYLLG